MYIVLIRTSVQKVKMSAYYRTSVLIYHLRAMYHKKYLTEKEEDAKYRGV